MNEISDPVPPSPPERGDWPWIQISFLVLSSGWFFFESGHVMKLYGIPLGETLMPLGVAIMIAGLPVLCFGLIRLVQLEVMGDSMPHTQYSWIRWFCHALFWSPVLLGFVPYVWSTARTNYLAAGPWQVIKAADDQGWLEVPGHWTADSPYKPAGVAIWATDGTGLAVSAFRRNNLDDPSLELRGFLEQAVSDPDYHDVTEPALIEVGGRPALQCVATATSKDQNLVFLITAVKTPENFWQITAMVERSRFEHHRPLLQQITQSLRTADARAAR